MSHLVLYRNFRPKTFDEVIGQDHIVQTLKNQVKNNNFGHAYLFCGTRGTGKTSCAKIFARAVNCLQPENGSPCGKCNACLSNLNGGNLDIVEIDAASNNRVDEIRDLREKIGYLPSVNKFKVYIVDEVHMLTDSAFNALLKTLEEPPSHAIFILATTEPQKLPATILSRCMRFDFKLVSEDDLIKHLANVFDKSGITYDQASLKLIAKNGQGSVRDTLSVAEMCSAYCNNQINYEKCQECLGVTSQDTLIEILSAVFTKNVKSLLGIFDKLCFEGKNFPSLVNDLIENVNALLSIKIMDNANDILKLPANVFATLQGLSTNVSNLTLVETLKILAQTDSQLKLASNPNMLVQTTLLSLIFNQSELDKINARLDELEKKTLTDVSVKTVLPSSEKLEQKNAQILDSTSEEQLTNTTQIEQTFQNSTQEMQEQSNIDVDFNNETNLPICDIEAKKIFGTLIKTLRQTGQMMLYSMLADVNVSLQKDTLLLICDEFVSQNLNDNKKVLVDVLKQFSTLKLEIVEKNANKNQTIEEFLKEKFGNRLQIV